MEIMQDANHTVRLTDCNDIRNCWNKDCAALNVLSEQPSWLIECWNRQVLLNLTAKIDGFEAPQHYIMWVCSIAEMIFTLRRELKHLWKNGCAKKETSDGLQGFSCSSINLGTRTYAWAEKENLLQQRINNLSEETRAIREDEQALLERCLLG